MIPVLQLLVEVPRGEVLRYMGYPRSKSPSPGVLARVNALWPLAQRLVDARGAFVLAGKADALTVGMPSPSERVAFGVCTAGLGLEDEVDRRTAAGEMLEALILDAFGSAAAEAAADALQARVCAAVQADALTASRRVSPGYGTWHVERQVDLLARLPAAQLGISLTEGSMMIPRKSVSFAAVLTQARQGRSRHRCAACDLVDCRYRRDDDRGRGAKEDTDAT